MVAGLASGRRPLDNQIARGFRVRRFAAMRPGRTGRHGEAWPPLNLLDEKERMT